MGFDQFISLFNPGEPLHADVGNRPLQQLAQNLSYILQRINAADLGSALYARQQAAAADVKVGTPVWFNPETNLLEKAVAAASHEHGAFVPAQSSRVWGIVSYKHTDHIVDVLIVGFAQLDISEVVTGTVTAGLYYLSTTPGQLTRQTPYGWPPLLAADGKGHVLLCPHWLTRVGEHTHHRVSLVCRPAGDVTPPSPGGRHTIDHPDPTRQGWLPAQHAIFNGKAPPAAVFGYNIAADPNLNAIWPVWNLDSVYLDWNKGIDASVGATAVPLGNRGLCVINQDGIWWMSDCYEDVPWPADWPAPQESESETDQVECPRFLHMQLDLYWTQPQFGNDRTFVTSLRSLSPNLSIACVDGSEADRGDLTLDLNLNFLLGNTNQSGSLVVKNLNDNILHRGKVVEGVYALTDNISLESDLPPVPSVDDDPDSAPMYQGRVAISVVDVSTRSLPVTLVRSADSGATEETYQNIMFLGLRAGSPVSYRGRLSVPDKSGFVTPKLRLRFLVLGRVAGTLPALQLTARRVPRPTSGLTVPENLPTSGSEFSVALTTTATLSSGYQYVEATSSDFSVQDGDLIFFTLSRPGSDTYTGEVGILDHKGLLSED